MTFSFAISEDQAKERFERFFAIDPFPDIPAALLNSSDIRSYVGATGMIFPFNDAKEKLKTASYEVDLLGKCVYWDGDEKLQVQEVKEGDEFTLRKNSIAFVTLRPIFRLPRYIALRFNLKITHVYRGILLGTGPLVDPGYNNQLYIPLHNLTNNDYVLRGGEGLIWMEFTKLSHPDTRTALQGIAMNLLPEPYPGDLVEFDPKKNQLTSVLQYIRKGEPQRSVRSSIPAVFHEAQDAALKAQDAAKTAGQAIETFQKRFTVGGFVTLAVAIIFGVYPIVSLVRDVSTASTSLTLRADAADKLIKGQDDRQKVQDEKQKALEQKLDSLQKELASVKREHGANSGRQR